METLEPLVNLLILLTVLSVAAERATNILKLRNTDLQDSATSNLSEKEREHRITVRSIGLGVLLAILVKANLFEIMAQLDSPWQTLGWVEVTAGQWSRSAATAGLGPFLYALAGSAITGVALGFGSKFWHEILDTVFEIRGIAKGLRKKYPAGGGGGAAGQASGVGSGNPPGGGDA